MVKKFLQVKEMNGKGKTPAVYAIPVIRITEQFIVTEENFVHGIQGFTGVERRNKQVAWGKFTDRRKGEQVCPVTHSFKAEKVVTEDEIAPGAIRL